MNQVQQHDAIQSVIDGVDQVASEMEAKWGVGRLELLVDDELRTKFRRQLERFNDAIQGYDLERVRQTGGGMRRAWEALDKAAAIVGAKQLDPEVWEIAMPDGKVIAFCKTMPEAFHVARAGRYIDVWTVEEVARLIEKFPEIALAKETFPGALIKSARSKHISEPIDVYVEYDADEQEPTPEGVKF